MLRVSALHYSTGNWEGFLDFGSAHVLPNYPLLMSEYFRCMLEVLRLVWKFWELFGSSEVNPELSVVHGGEQ